MFRHHVLSVCAASCALLGTALLLDFASQARAEPGCDLVKPSGSVGSCGMPFNGMACSSASSPMSCPDGVHIPYEVKQDFPSSCINNGQTRTNCNTPDADCARICTCS